MDHCADLDVHALVHVHLVFVTAGLALELERVDVGGLGWHGGDLTSEARGGSRRAGAAWAIGVDAGPLSAHGYHPPFLVVGVPSISVVSATIMEVRVTRQITAPSVRRIPECEMVMQRSRRDRRWNRTGATNS